MSTVLKLVLKPHLCDFLRHELDSDEKGDLLLTRRSDIGKYICSQITELDVKNFTSKINASQTCQVLNFVVPRNAQNHYICEYRYCGVSKWAEQKINDFLEIEFKQRVRLLFEAGRKRGFKQKDIINAILEEYNIKNCALNYDTIKKYDYRHNRKMCKILYNTMQSIVV